MTKAFVFGKFLPFHKGHEAMVNFAMRKCDHLTILICCSNKEDIPGSIRNSWIREIYKDKEKINIQVLEYNEEEYPNTSASSSKVSEVWAFKFKELLPDCSLLVTSEPYGDFVATFMNIRHKAFDIERKIIPISATKIREDFYTNWNYLPDPVKKYYLKKIVILGTESTGKTTLTNNLANYFNTSYVLEAAREIIKDSKSFTMEDLYSVANEHAKKINRSVNGSPLLIIDTDVHITQSYADHFFQKTLDLPPDIYNTNKAALYLYLDKNIDFVQDGTRLKETDRNLLDLSHRKILSQHNIPFQEISGNWEERFTKAVGIIEGFLKNDFRIG
jgi:HTH-type transcriptional repressor of NAD biosynthesis genes